MASMVWVSTAPGYPGNLRYLRNDVGEADHKRLVTIANKIVAGKPLDAEELPKTIFGAPDARERHYRFPDLFYAYGYWIVSKAAADILDQFDLGEGGLSAVQVFRKDRRTPVEGEWFCLDFGNRKEAFLASRSTGLTEWSGGRWYPRAALKDNMIAVSEMACEGPDIWIDPRVAECIFLSGDLGRALRAAKAGKGFFLKKCRVVEGA